MLRIVTPRLLLRPLVDQDLSWVHALNVLPEVRRFLFDDDVWTEEQTAERLMSPNRERWASEHLGLLAVEYEGRPVGWTGFWYFHEPPVREVGYALHPDVWGRGFAREATRGVMAWGQQYLGDVAFCASTDAPNVASIRVLEALGFAEVGRSPGLRHETVHFWRAADHDLVRDIRVEDGPASPSGDTRGA